MVDLRLGDSREVLKTLADCSVDSIVCDPPYEIGFMQKGWDKSGIAYDMELWRECLRVLKPGGYLSAFGATRSYHRMACAIEDAGFDIRDTLTWIYKSGFPKGLDIAKAIDRQAGYLRGERGELLNTNGSMENPNYARTDKGEPITDEAKEWAGWWTTLKPACEPIVLAQKPVKGGFIDNIRNHGVGALNIDACRHEAKYPMNVLVDEESKRGNAQLGYFYCPKASKSERDYGLEAIEEAVRKCYNGTAKGNIGGNRPAKNVHPTVKPIELMRWLCRLTTPKGGCVLDPFLGSGTTGIAARLEGFDFVGVELSAEYMTLAKHRINAWEGRARKIAS